MATVIVQFAIRHSYEKTAMQRVLMINGSDCPKLAILIMSPHRWGIAKEIPAPTPRMSNTHNFRGQDKESYGDPAPIREIFPACEIAN